MSAVKRHPDAPKFDTLYIDSDILCYEMPFGAEYVTDEGEKQVRDFDFVIDSVARWDAFIKGRLGCNNLNYFLTGKGNFREKVAVSKPYKDSRPPKPFHHKATREWLMYKYGAEVVDGMEADDYVCYLQQQAINQGKSSCIVTRDKDLGMMEGWLYVWACGKQPEKLTNSDYLGYLTITRNAKKKPKLSGRGVKFFYAQMLMGDIVDTIPALTGYGPVKTYNILADCETESQLFSVVRTCYHKAGYDDTYLLEQAYLLWMCREINDGVPVMWKPPLEVE